MRWRRPSKASSIPRWERPSRSRRSARPSDRSSSTLGCSSTPARTRCSMYARSRCSSTTAAMPRAASRWASTSPAGPAPTTATSVSSTITADMMPRPCGTPHDEAPPAIPPWAATSPTGPRPPDRTALGAVQAAWGDRWGGATASSGEQLGLLGGELGVGDHALVLQVGELGQLVGAGGARPGGLADVRVERGLVVLGDLDVPLGHPAAVGDQVDQRAEERHDDHEDRPERLGDPTHLVVAEDVAEDPD